MNWSKVLGDDKDAKSNTVNRAITLNPNAAEFVPSSSKSTNESVKSSDATRLNILGSSRKGVLDRSESTNSNNSDDEARRYWQSQLPDDITPDFNAMVEEEMHGSEHLSLAGLSLHENDGGEQPSFSASMGMGNQRFGMRHGLSSVARDDLSFIDKIGYSSSSAYDDQSSAAFMASPANSWGKHFLNGEQLSINGGEGHLYHADYNGNTLVNDLIGDDALLQNSAIGPIEFLSAQFPGFSVQSLADVYYGNGCDLSSTIEILTQLELQVDGSFNQNSNSKTLVTPSLSMLDFPALPAADAQTGLSKYAGEETRGTSSAYRTSSSLVRGDIDYASAVKKLSSQDGGHWRYERHNVANGAGVGSSRNSQVFASSQNGNGKAAYRDKLHNSGGARAAPIWLETGETVGDMYTKSREEARDYARIRNACFEQATQAYLIGNKALAKELSLKGQLYDIQMKAAHEKAKDDIFRQRNPSSAELHGYYRGQDHLIDLHGLHVNEAIHVLNNELSILRSTARSTGQRLQVMVCVGTGHHTRGSRTPVRLPVAVEQYLLEKGLQFSQPQPGMLRVVIY